MSSWEDNPRVRRALLDQSRKRINGQKVAPKRASRVNVRKSTPHKMNKAEAAYAAQVLDPMVAAGEVREYRHEALGLRLTNSDPGEKQRRPVYWPDFLVIRTDGDRVWPEVHEVKGHVEDDWVVKFTVARDQFPWLVFRCFMAKRKAGRYEFEETRKERAA